MSNIELIEGEIFIDERGKISSLNCFDFSGVERFYFVKHDNVDVVRGWHGHKFEKKWFYCVKGSFTVALVQPDNWETPSEDLEVEFFKLTDKESRIVCVPEGYANCIKAAAADSILLVFSNKKLPEAYQDSWRYDKRMWVDWTKY